MDRDSPLHDDARSMLECIEQRAQSSDDQEDPERWDRLDAVDVGVGYAHEPVAWKWSRVAQEAPISGIVDSRNSKHEKKWNLSSQLR